MNKAKRNNRRKEERKRRKELGLCRWCKEPVCKNSTVFCELHLEKNRKSSSNRAKTNKESQKYYRIKSRAKANKIDFEIDLVEFEKWHNDQPKVCRYCQIEECVLNDHPDKKQKNLTIDRKDSEIGYQIDNLCLACFRCNNAKSNFFTFEEWSHIAESFIRPRLDEYHKMCSCDK